MPTPWVTTVREDVVTRLVAAGTAAGSRVYSWRTTPLEAGDLPAIVVRSGLDRSTTAQRSGVAVESVNIVIECYVEGSTDAVVAANSDALEEQVFLALWNDATWTNQDELMRVEPQPADALDINVESAKRRGRAVQAWKLTRARVQTPTTTGDALSLLVASIHIRPDEDLDATVEVAL